MKKSNRISAESDIAAGAAQSKKNARKRTAAKEEWEKEIDEFKASGLPYFQDTAKLIMKQPCNCPEDYAASLVSLAVVAEKFGLKREATLARLLADGAIDLCNAAFTLARLLVKEGNDERKKLYSDMEGMIMDLAKFDFESAER